jgi:large subunit ribosomal protein L15
MIKTKKRKKSSRMHGKNMGTHGGGARKKRKGSGHRGGTGMSGSGKRADHKKTLVLKLYGNKYFGKGGITSKGTKRDTRKRINIGDIQANYKPGEINLSKYKILGKGEVKEKFVITALEASKSAIEKIKKVGGSIDTLKKEKVEEKKKAGKKEEVKEKEKDSKEKVKEEKKKESEKKKDNSKEKVKEGVEEREAGKKEEVKKEKGEEKR